MATRRPDASYTERSTLAATGSVSSMRVADEDGFGLGADSSIRATGAGQIQVARRLRAMLDNLTGSLPPHRHPVLNEQCQRLDQAIAVSYAVPADMALAREPDPQGLGGTRPQPS